MLQKLQDSSKWTSSLNRNKKDGSFLAIAFFVIAAHAMLVGWSVFFANDKTTKVRASEKLTIKTITLREKPKAPALANSPLQEAQKPPPVKKVETPPKVEAPKPSPKVVKKEKVKPVPKQAPKKAAEPIKSSPKTIDPTKDKQRQLLAKAKESIAKIDPKHAKISAFGKTESSPAAKVPKAIEGLHIDAIQEEGRTLNERERGYREELASRLRLLLRLPEHGEVKVKLTLDRSGQVVKVVTVSAQSKANQHYIEKTIPTLAFPSFGENFKDFAKYTFLISLSNE